MNPQQIKVLVQSKSPVNGSKLWYQLMYGDDIWGGKVTPDVKIKGDVYIPNGSWVTGKCELKDVRIPDNTNIISLSVHDKHASITQIGDFELVKDFRVRRGVYVSGLVRVYEHEELRARIIVGYELKVYGRIHTHEKVYKQIQKNKK